MVSPDTLLIARIEPGSSEVYSDHSAQPLHGKYYLFAELKYFTTVWAKGNGPMLSKF